MRIASPRWSSITPIRIVGILLSGVLSALGSAPAIAAEPPVDFIRDIQPILSKTCYACHGPDEEQRQSGLRLDDRASATTPLSSGFTAIVPGKPDESELYQRIIADDPAERMPPKESGHVLTAAQISRLRRWIEQGAEYSDHWAFVKPTRPAFPAISDSAWPRNGIDRFILAELDRAGLKPSPAADRYALIRRLSLDLRGLPPTPEEVRQFVNDRRPDAYEQLVDRFLADPAFGERWARMWLDLARYADSAGYGSDPLRTNIWRYRDWVIDAFNRNLPFDQFTIEQLAGDLLPEPTLEQRIATAFHRNTMTNTEGGTDDEEFRVEAVKDRVDTTMQVWMGLTMGCAKCHSHKYEPISQVDYYRFYAFFNQTADADRGDESPTMPAPNAEMTAKLREIDAQIAELKQKLDTPTDELAAAQVAWERELGAEPAWTILAPRAATAESGTALRILEDGAIRAEGDPADVDTYVITAKSGLAGITAFRLETLPDPAFPQGAAGRAKDGNFVLSRFSVATEPDGKSNATPVGRFVRVELPGEGKMLSLAEVQVFGDGKNLALAGQATQSSTGYGGVPQRAIDGNTDGDYFKANSTTHTNPEANPWWEVDLGKDLPVERIVVWNRTDGGVGVRLANFRVSLLDAGRRVLWQQEIAEPPAPNRELSPTGVMTVTLSQAAADFSNPQFPITAALEGKKPDTEGWSVHTQQSQSHSAVFIPAETVSLDETKQLVFRLDQRFQSPQHLLGKFRLSVTADANVQRRLKVPREILAIVDLPAEQRSDAQREQLAAYYRSIAPALQPLRNEIARLEKSRPVVPMLPIMQELPADKRRPTHVLVKGNFLSPGEAVEPGTPEAFHAFPAEAPRNRLGVAQWLVDPENPLTARVMVNRFWAQLFGTGLVETEEDFGTQGELPSHPELLDWLAVEFMSPTATEHAGATPRAWDMKALLRLIVTSATYRQTSAVSPDRLEKDPRNRLLSRGPRFRLEAEMVRDQALALSGLLSRKTHGPSVFPPQPPNLWQAAFNGQRNWATSTGEDRYRRGLYTFWRRTVPYPSMATFDAPSREICSIRRIRTNTPLQAFVTMNDPVYVEAAQGLARRIAREGGSSPAELVRFGLELCLIRPPQVEEIQTVVELYESELAHYRDHPQEAVAIATEPLGPLPEGMPAPELAAWTVVANVLLNLDGVLSKN